MRIRIGDLVTVGCEHCKNQKGFVTGLDGRGYISKGCFEFKVKGEDLGTIDDKRNITDVIPREKVKEYWKYL